MQDTIVRFHESSNWAMVFDHQLNLLRLPAEFTGYKGEMFAVAFPRTLSAHDHGIPEMIAYDLVMKTITIYRNDFTHPVRATVEFTNPERVAFSFKRAAGHPPLISMCSDNLSYMLFYQFNRRHQPRREGRGARQPAPLLKDVPLAGAFI